MSPRFSDTRTSHRSNPTERYQLSHLDVLEAESIHILREVVAQFARPVLRRFRTLGCSPCTGAIESSATTVAAIIEEIQKTDSSERANRVIDHGSDGAMEQKKQEGYF